MNYEKSTFNFCISILFLVTFSCNNDDDLSNNGNSTSITGTWELIQFEDQDGGMIHTPPEDSANPITITFEADTFQGNTAANSFFGDYSLLSNQLIIENMGSTLVAESVWGAMFFEAMTSAVMTYSVEGNRLMIEYDESEFMHFSKR